MLQLLKYALAKPPAPGYSVDKFAFVSSEHLPVKPLRFIREELGKRPDESDFCVHPIWWWMTLKGDNTTQTVTCYQWSILSRKDAITLRERMPDPSPTQQLIVPRVEGHAWNDFNVHHCVDEVAVFMTIFGLAHVPSDYNHPVNLSFPGFGTLEYPHWTSQGRCDYFGAEGWPAVKAEKGDEQAQAVMALTKIPDSSIIGPPSHCDPGVACEVIWVIEMLGPEGLRLLRESKYFFARKFAASAALPNYASVVFA
mmetsp:Transcript_95779/g.188055  ORF Transcript_95779/g.188055 Transcript_95779/m.188055 type:complete len:254 (+) Transcript_95779:2-763(+)